ncbi:MAG: DUF5615 family PIN-like protein [Planctomycetota bacterium]
MKLLFDQNLSPRLAVKLSDLFPGSAHVQALGLADVPDKSVWDFARHIDPSLKGRLFHLHFDRKPRN